MAALELNLDQRHTIKQAIKNNDLEMLKAFSPYELAAFKHDKYTNIFLYAVANGKLEIVQTIVEALKKLNCKEFEKIISSIDVKNRNALMLSARLDEVSKIQYLIDHLKFNYDERNPSGFSALTYAIHNNSKNAFKCLMKFGASFEKNEERAMKDNDNFNQYFNSPKSFLHIIKTRNIAAFLRVIKYVKTQSEEKQKPFLDEVDDEGRNALILACALRLNSIISILSTLSFNLNVVDKHGQGAISYLVHHQLIDFAVNLLNRTTIIAEADRKILAEHAEKFIKATKASKKRIGDALTNNPDNFTRTGRIPKTPEKEIVRPKRSFIEERERQLLRQVATQLYISFNKKLKEQKIEGLAEVQILHLRFSGKPFLFIAANEYLVSKELPAFIKDKQNLKELLTSTHFIKDIEGRERSSRYAKKLENRIYSDTPQMTYQHAHDEKNTQEVLQLLRERPILRLDVNMGPKNVWTENSMNTLRNVLLNRGNEIYILVVQNCYYKLRHAEEFLTDITEFALSLSKELNIPEPYSCIGGKKRPCMGCSGRMQNVISQYGERPGRFWSNTIEQQNENAAVNTMTLLLSRSSYVSKSDNGQLQRDYDSGSDSEFEPDSPRL